VEEIERIHERLQNIKTIEPILSALRTVAGATWRGALNRMERVRRYAAQLQEVLTAVAPYAASGPLTRDTASAPNVEDALLVIAAERGLCGGFNRTILTAAEELIDKERSSGRSPQLLTLGEQARRRLDQLGIPILRSDHLPVTSLPPYTRAEELAEWALKAHEAGIIGGLSIIHNRYLSAMAYIPRVRQVLPTQPVPHDETEPTWPPPIIDGDPTEIHALTLKRHVTAQVYAAVIESAACEQAARFQTMERSSQNAERLIEELSLRYHQARQESITQEMLDLAVGAGLVAGGRQEERYHG